MFTNNRGNITAQEDDEEKDSNEEHNNRISTDCIEQSSDENSRSNNKVGSGTSPGISHKISQISGGSHSDSCCSVSGALCGNPQGYEDVGPVDNSTTSANSHSRRSSVGNNTNYPDTPSVIFQ